MSLEREGRAEEYSDRRSKEREASKTARQDEGTKHRGRLRQVVKTNHRMAREVYWGP